MQGMFSGFDLSLNGTGIVVIDDACTILLQEKLTPPQGCVGVERLFFLQEQLHRILERKIISFGCLEGPAYGRGEGGRLFEIGEWTGVVKLNLFTQCIPFIIATPSQLKKYVTGQGKGGKELIILDVYKNFHVEIRDNDLADAYVLARIARDYHFFVHDPETLVVKTYQSDILKNIYKRFAPVEL